MPRIRVLEISRNDPRAVIGAGTTELSGPSNHGGALLQLICAGVSGNHGTRTQTIPVPPAGPYRSQVSAMFKVPDPWPSIVKQADVNLWQYWPKLG